MRHAKNQQCRPYIGGKNQQIETLLKEAQTLELMYMDLISTILNMF